MWRQIPLRVEVPDEKVEEQGHQGDGVTALELMEALRDTIKRQDETITQLQGQLQTKDMQLDGKDRQIGELHVLVQRAQAALPAPKDGRPWWRFWGR